MCAASGLSWPLPSLFDHQRSSVCHAVVWQTCSQWWSHKIGQQVSPSPIQSRGTSSPCAASLLALRVLCRVPRRGETPLPPPGGRPTPLRSCVPMAAVFVFFQYAAAYWKNAQPLPSSLAVVRELKLPTDCVNKSLSWFICLSYPRSIFWSYGPENWKGASPFADILRAILQAKFALKIFCYPA